MSAQKPQQKQQSNVGNMLVAATIVALFPMSIYYLNKQTPENPGIRAMMPYYMTDSTTDEAVVETPEPIKPEYEFYSLLPEIQVDVGMEVPEILGASALLESKPRFEKPKEVVVQPAAARQQSPSNTAELNRSVAAGTIQVGAYSNRQHAETMRARLAMLGFRSNLTTINSGGRNLIRVSLGNLSADRLEQARMRLKRAGINDFAVIR